MTNHIHIEGGKFHKKIFNHLGKKNFQKKLPMNKTKNRFQKTGTCKMTNNTKKNHK